MFNFLKTIKFLILIGLVLPMFLFAHYAFGQNASSSASSSSELNTNFVQHFEKKDIVNGNNKFNLKLISEKKDFSISELPEMSLNLEKNKIGQKHFFLF